MAMPFSAYFALDAYSTQSKLMGRQKNGEHFLQALVDRAMHSRGQAETAWAGFESHAPQSLQDLLLKAGFRGALRWQCLQKSSALSQVGVLYYPAPPTADLGNLRSATAPAAYSLMGLTHTLSSTGAMDQLCDLALPPFEDWDALICTSEAARYLAAELIDSTQRAFARRTGASRFPKVQLPVIPLGVQASRFNTNEFAKSAARKRWALSPSDFVVLFVGRLTFHAKANPAPMYQALESLAKEVPERRILCLECGQFPNQGIESAFEAARAVLAPNVKFISVDGSDDILFNDTWRAADVFLSCSDNIQETFGLTPIEAMAARLPVVVSDWNGYKSTVIDERTGFRIPTLLPSPSLGAGSDLALRHAMQIDTYDYYIGRVSMSTVIDPARIVHALKRLAQEPQLARVMGEQAHAHVLANFDWSVIIPQYEALAKELNQRRMVALKTDGEAGRSTPWIQRKDPFTAFAHFATGHLELQSTIHWHTDAKARWDSMKHLAMVRYGFNAELGDESMMDSLLAAAKHLVTAKDWIDRFPRHLQPGATRMLMMAAKLDLCRLQLT